MKRIVFLLATVIFSLNANAQSIWGNSVADSVTCYESYNIFGSFYQSKDYAAAFDPWFKVYETCPAAKKATYIYGPKIVETKIGTTADAGERQQYVDLLIELYDNRLKYFPGKEGYVLSEKASKYIKYNKDSVERASELFDADRKSVV